jgi:dGTPase
MIYIAYAVSGPIKRIFLDALIQGLKTERAKTDEEAKSYINIRGVVRQKAESYDDFEVTTVENVDELYDKYGEDYCYKNEENFFGVDKRLMEIANNAGTSHFVLCNNGEVINKIQSDFGKGVKLLHVTFKNYQNVLDVVCSKYNDNVNDRRQKIDEFNRDLETSGIEWDVNVDVDNHHGDDESSLLKSIWVALKDKINEKYYSWINLLNTSSLSSEIRADKGLRFEQDYSNVINSSAFRRLQDKAQVFPLERHDYVRTRLTHSVECATIAEELGIRAIDIINSHKESGFIELCRNIPALLKTAALLHDMGNPPFGHFGEDVIRDWFKENLGKIEYDGQKLEAIIGKKSQEYEDLINFEGNAQLLRLVTKLSMVNGCSDYGLDLTCALLATIVKYPVNSTEVDPKILSKKKVGYFSSESNCFEIVQGRIELKSKRHPLTFLLEAADDISYLTSDIQDAYHKRLFSIETIRNAFKDKERDLSSESSKAVWNRISEILNYKIPDVEDALSNDLVLGKLCSFLRTQMITDCISSFNEHYADIMSGEHEEELLSCTESSRNSVNLIREILKEYVYDEDSINNSEISASRILSKLLEVFISAALEFKEEHITSLNSRIHNLLSENYKYICAKNINSVDGRDRRDILAQKTYHKILLATDYICGMTDSYAKEIYNLINASI